ncbi:MAG: FAD-binding protein [Alphaproteobacteria bacterium]|nr:FAD-binding protein [Alphaproteobacteria bacterium]
MTGRIKADICVIGGGSGGLSLAAGAAQLGQKVVLIEKGKMGGDCLNYGCVPSKALIAASKRAHAFRASAEFGIAPAEPVIDFRRVHDHIHEVIAAIAPIDSVERFEGLGVTVIQAPARFTGPMEIEAGGKTIRARRIVIATGSRAGVPPIPGLSEVPYLTNETLFDNVALPRHLIIIGAGPIGMEMAQAHRRLGAEVTVLDAGPALAKDDPELTKIVLDRLRHEGIVLRESVKIARVAGTDGAITVTLSGDAGEETITGSHLLVAAGRVPNVEGLDLEKAGVRYSRRGIEVDSRLRSSNKKIFAVGDVAGGLQFTHVANYHAGLVIRNVLFRFPASQDTRAIPWCTYTDPELAHVGLTEEEARKSHGQVTVLRWHLKENDRAQAERETEGLAKIVVDKRGRILGASIVAPGAGDLIQVWVLAITKKLKIADVQAMVVAYPTLGEISKRAAGAYFTPTLFSPRVRLLVRLLTSIG